MPGRSQSGLPRAQVCCSHQLLTAPFWEPLSQLDRHRDTHTVRGKAALGKADSNKSITRGRGKRRSARRGCTYRGEALAAVPLSPAAAV